MWEKKDILWTVKNLHFLHLHILKTEEQWFRYVLFQKVQERLLSGKKTDS